MGLYTRLTGIYTYLPPQYVDKVLPSTAHLALKLKLEISKFPWN